MTTADSMPQCNCRTELLTAEQFAERVHLSRATIFAWVQRGILENGKHFLKFGRVVRFIWSDNTLELLLIESKKGDLRSTAKSAPRAQQAKPIPINWEY